MWFELVIYADQHHIHHHDLNISNIWFSCAWKGRELECESNEFLIQFKLPAGWDPIFKSCKVQVLPPVNPVAKSTIWVKMGNFPNAWLWLFGFYLFLIQQLFIFICNSGSEPKFCWTQVKCLQIWFPQGLIWSRWSHWSQIFLQINIQFFCYIIFCCDWHFLKMLGSCWTNMRCLQGPARNPVQNARIML